MASCYFRINPFNMEYKPRRTSVNYVKVQENIISVVVA